jgi:hypothetical protein
LPALASCAAGIQGLLGHIDPKYGVSHLCYRYCE